MHFPQNKTHPGIPKPRLFTVGRLDVATTGLIIVTNDGKHISRELFMDLWVNIVFDQSNPLVIDLFLCIYR